MPHHFLTFTIKTPLLQPSWNPSVKEMKTMASRLLFLSLLFILLPSGQDTREPAGTRIVPPDGAAVFLPAWKGAVPAAAQEGDGDKLRQAPESVKRWIDAPKEKWPKIAMINSIQYTDKTFPVAGCGCLVEAGGKIYAVTAKHVLLYFKSEKMDSVHFQGTLKRWRMFPKDRPEDFVEVDRLVNADENESLLDRVSPERDWLVFTVKKRSKNIQPLKFRKTPPAPGEKVYIVGWRYSDKDCTQRVYEGEFVRMEKGSFLLSTTVLADNKMPGLSGAPVIDSNGDLIGIMCQKAGKMERPSSTAYPMKMLKKVE
jgi:hypothetical protein